MDTTRILTQLPIIMGLRLGVFILFVFLSSLATASLAALCTYSSRSDYSLPALKSLCMEYVCSTWRFLLHPAESLSSELPHTRLITSGNIFLLVNLIILALLVNTHIQQHTSGAAVQRSSSRKKRQLQQTKRPLLDDNRQAAPAEKSMESLSHVRSGEAANSSREAFPTSSAYADWRPLPAASVESWKGDLRDPYEIQYGEEIITTSMTAEGVHEGLYEASVALESSIPDVATMHDNPSTEDQESSTVESHRANSSNVEQIVLEEDGRLRLVDGEGIDSAKTGDGELRLANEDIEGSDAEMIVLQEDGRLRFIDRPLAVSGFPSRPLKSLSDASYCPEDDNQDTNYEINCLNDGIHSLNANHNSSLSEPINGSANPDHSSDPALDDHGAASFSNESSSKRPIRVKKADSLDTTWKAINQNKGNTVISTTHRNKDSKHLIRQRSRQGFKPNTRGLMRDSNGNINSSNKGRSSAVRREPSIGQEELNAKVESFIARFNEQIRIQRQDSILSFMQMVDRGA